MQLSFQSLCSPVQMYSAYARHRVRSGTWIVVILWLRSQSLLYTALCQFAHIHSSEVSLGLHIQIELRDLFLQCSPYVPAPRVPLLVLWLESWGF